MFTAIDELAAHYDVKRGYSSDYSSTHSHAMEVSPGTVFDERLSWAAGGTTDLTCNLIGSQ